MIDLLGVGVADGPDRWLLHRICARLDAGRMVAVVSSRERERQALLDTLTGRHVPEEGRVWIQGVPVMNETRARIRVLVADVDPAGPVFERWSLLWNVLSGSGRPLGWLRALVSAPWRSARTSALTVLARVGLERLAHAPASTLDAEGRMRLALARRPPVLVVREADRTVDPTATLRIIDLLGALIGRERRTVVVVGLDDPSLAASCGARVVALVDGRVG